MDGTRKPNLSATSAAVALVFAAAGCGGTTATQPSDPPVAPAAAIEPPAASSAGQALSTWPFRAWNRAEVIGFNRTQNDGPLRLYAYNERHGWNPYIEERRRLEVALAEQAVGMVFETEGAVGTSKCPMPRHAVVLYDGDAPVASINVCFECGDLLIWPDFDPTPEPEPDLDSMTEAEYAAYEARIAESMRFVDLYENEVFPRWVTFFRDRVGMPIGALYDPASSDQKEQ